MRENRQHDRAAAVIKVNYSSQGALKMDYAQNISRGGLFLATSSSFELGQEIVLQMHTSGLSAPIPVPGVVRWIGERGVPPVRGVGVQFALQDPEARARIERMISSLDEPEAALSRKEGGVLVYILDPNEFAAQMYAEGIERMAKAEGEALEGPVTVRRFTDLEQLYAALEQRRCDVLIIELRAKTLDGAAVIEELTERHHGELSIFAISRPFEGDRELALSAGATAFLNKPLQMRALFNTLALCARGEEA